MTSELLFFEDIEAGMRREFPAVEITQEMVDRHVELYGQDWPEGSVPEGVVPSPLVVSILGGQGGAANWLAIHRMREYTLWCNKPILIGDTINVVNSVLRVEPRRDPDKEYGYVIVSQDVFNRGDRAVAAYDRTMKYTVWKRNAFELQKVKQE